METAPFKYYSLGLDCEVGFQLKRAKHLQNDDFFAWCYAPMATLLKLIDEEFAGLAAADQLVRWGPDYAGIVEDRKYGLQMHSPFGVDGFGGADHERIRVFFAAGMAQRAATFFRQLRDGNLVYIRKYEGQDAAVDAAKLTELLARKAGHDHFLVVFLQEAAAAPDGLAMPNLLPLYVERFAPPGHADLAHEPSWDAIFEAVTRHVQDGRGLSRVSIIEPLSSGRGDSGAGAAAPDAR